VKRERKRKLAYSECYKEILQGPAPSLATDQLACTNASAESSILLVVSRCESVRGSSQVHSPDGWARGEDAEHASLLLWCCACWHLGERELRETCTEIREEQTGSALAKHMYEC
jgi:hypothetical protein